MKRKQTAFTCVRYLLLIIIMIFLLFPIYWMVVTALKTNMEAYLYPPTFLPEEPTIASFKSLLTTNNQFFVYYKNNFVEQVYLPKEVQDQHFWKGQNNPAEQKLVEHMRKLWGDRF